MQTTEHSNIQQQANSSQIQLNPQSDQQPIHQTKNIFIYILLCIFAFFYYFSPSQPFFVEYLVNYKNIDVETVLFSIYPIWSYSYPFVQILTGWLTEIFNHRTIILFGMFASVLSNALVVLASGKDTMWIIQASQVMFAISMAAHQTFFAIQYHVSPQDKYQLITSLTRGFLLLGHVLGAVVGQGLHLANVDLNILFYITLGGALPCIYISLAHLPAPTGYIIPMPEKIGNLNQRVKAFFVQIFSNYTKYYVVYWSICVIGAASTHSLAITYYQTLFKTINPSKTFNGFVIAGAYIVAAIATCFPPRMEKLMEKFGAWIVFSMLLWMGGCVILLGFDFIPVVVAYGLFILYHAGFEFIYVTALAQIAKHLKVTRFAAIFSVNACLQNITQLIIQAIIQGLKFDARAQYKTFGICTFATAAILGLMSLVSFLFHRKKYSRVEEEEEISISSRVENRT